MFTRNLCTFVNIVNGLMIVLSGSGAGVSFVWHGKVRAVNVYACRYCCIVVNGDVLAGTPKESWVS